MADTESLLAQSDRGPEPAPSSSPPQADEANRLGPPDSSQFKVHGVIWTVIFAASVAVVFLAAIINLFGGSVCHRNQILNICDVPFSAVVALVLCAYASALFGFVWIAMMSRPQFSPNIIGFSTAVNILLWSGIGLISSAHGIWYSAIIAVFCCTAAGALYLSMRHRLDFTSVLLEISFGCQRSNLLIRTVFIAQSALILYSVIWLVAISSSSSLVFILLMFINQIWAANVTISVIYVMSGSVLSSWYFTPQSSFELSADAAQIFKTRFGSICFGSLAIAIAQTLRILAQGSVQTGAPGSCLAACIFGILEYSSNFVTRFAFSYVAVWGVDFCSAVEKTSTLLRTRAVDVFVNYNFTYVVVWASASIGGLFGVVIGSIFYFLIGGHSYIAMVVTLSYSIGFAMMFLAVTMVESIVDSLMVVWAEVPDALSANHHSEYQRLVTSIRQIRPFIAPDSNI